MADQRRRGRDARRASGSVGGGAGGGSRGSRGGAGGGGRGARGGGRGAGDGRGPSGGRGAGSGPSGARGASRGPGGASRGPGAGRGGGGRDERAGGGRGRDERGPGGGWDERGAGRRGAGRPGKRGSEQRQQRGSERAAAPASPPAAGREPRTLPDDVTILYGRNAVHEALRGPREVQHIWATAHTLEEPWLAEVAHDSSAVDVNVVADGSWIERRSGSPDHQGVCAQVAPFRYAYVDELLAVEQPLIVALDEIQDPQNLGAIARTAECAGATGLVIPARRSADVTPAVCKASAGAVEHLPIARARNLADFLGDARGVGAWVYGAEGDGGVPYTGVDYSGPGVVLVLGSEGRGLRPRVAASCDALIALPLRGRIGSLNVSAAASALLYEIVRQRG